MARDGHENPTAEQQRKPRRRWARGPKRPEYLRPSDIDRIMIMMVALTGEVSALRDRVDTHEALAELGVVATTAAVERYELTGDRQAKREADRQSMLKRVLRAILEEREAAIDKAGRPDGDDPVAG